MWYRSGDRLSALIDFNWHRKDQLVGATEQESRILKEVQAVNLKLDELRSTHALAPLRKAVSAVESNRASGSEQGSQLSLDPGEGKKAEDKSDSRMSSMVKRVVEATGHGLDGLLEAARPARSARSPAPNWTTTSHALRPISQCVLSGLNYTSTDPFSCSDST